MKIQQYFPYLNDEDLVKFHPEAHASELLSETRFYCSSGERRVFMLLDDNRTMQGEVVINFKRHRAFIHSLSVNDTCKDKGYEYELLKKALENIKLCGCTECMIQKSKAEVLMPLLTKLEFAQDGIKGYYSKKVA